MKLYDSHTHTKISPDGHSTAADMWAAAESAGLTGLCITNHCDIPTVITNPEDENFRASDGQRILKFSNPDLDAWIVERDTAKDLGLRYGLEIGNPLTDMARASYVTALTQPDFIIGSMHAMNDTPDFYYLKKDAPDFVSLQARYFTEMLEMTKVCDFDVIGHLTYPWRCVTLPDEPVDILRHEEILRGLFRALAERGRGIEINTSGLRNSAYSNFGRCLPDLDVIELFRECGGEVLTIGSDAHRASDVGFSLQAGHDLAKAAGFTHAAFFTDRKPVFYAL